MLEIGKENRESGQGLVEYALIIVLVVLAIVFFTVRSCMRKNRNDPEPTPAQGDPAIDIVGMGTEAQIIDTETVPLYNCDNSNTYELELERVRKVTHDITVGGEAQGGIDGIIVGKLQGRYGFEEGQTEERSYTVHLTAAPNSWTEYTIEWKYIWRTGEARLTHEDGSVESIPYRIRAAIEFEIVNIEHKNCSEP
jgi:heme/copper-type cytochrome/quinol oxidase subunit 2